jgi:hypothetical protein
MSRLRATLRSAKKTDLVWRYVYNLVPTLNYGVRLNKPLTSVESNLVAMLNQDGIAVTSVDDLLGHSLEFKELYLTVADLLEDKKEEIAALKLNADEAVSIGNKTFNLEALGSELSFDPESVFARFALNRTFLNIADAYFRMRAKLRYYNVWYTAASASTARESQLWHFDREDNYILKIFLYLDDVDEGAGPFTYAPGTHKKGRFRSIEPEYFLEGGVRRTTDEQMDAVYPRAEWKTCIGKKGTIVFADTRGYHKGGEARTKDRLMYTCMYTSPASESRQLIKIPADLDTSLLGKMERQALGLKESNISRTSD